MQNTPSNVNFISDLTPGNGNDATPFAQQSVVLTKQAYDATEDETPRQHRDDDFNPEQLMHELEDFLRQERDRGAE